MKVPSGADFFRAFGLKVGGHPDRLSLQDRQLFNQFSQLIKNMKVGDQLFVNATFPPQAVFKKCKSSGGDCSCDIVLPLKQQGSVTAPARSSKENCAFISQSFA